MAESRPARMGEPETIPTLFAEGCHIERGEDFVRLVFWTCLENVEYAPPEKRIVMRAALTTNGARAFMRELRKADVWQ